MHYQITTKNKLTAIDPIMDERGLAYGDGFFSTLGVFDGKILCKDGHNFRLRYSGQVFGISLNADDVMAKLDILAQNIRQGILKIIVTRQTQSVHGYGFSLDKQGMQAVIYIKSVPSLIYQDVRWVDGVAIQQPIAMTTLSLRLGLRCLPLQGLKLIACPEHVLAHSELLQYAKNFNVQDGLVQDFYGNWQCATMGNIYYRWQEKWYTPPIVSGVSGVMRHHLLQRYNITQRTLVDDDLSQITALCVSNAVRGIIPVDCLYYQGMPLTLSRCTPITPMHQ